MMKNHTDQGKIAISRYHKNEKTILEFRRRQRLKRSLLALAVAIIFLALSVIIVRQARIVSTKQMENRGYAGSESQLVSVSLYPPTINQKKGENIILAPKLNGPADKKIGFISLTFQFNPSHLKLKKIEENNFPNLTRLTTTTLDEANQTGLINNTLGAIDGNQAPTGVVNLPSFGFEILTDTVSNVSLNLEKSQIVFMNQELAVLKLEKPAVVDSRISPTPKAETPSITKAVSPSPTAHPVTTAPTDTPTQPSATISPAAISPTLLPITPTGNQ